jgi:hypothetical protein
MGLAAIQREKGRGKTQKNLFLKKTSDFLLILEESCNFAK